jgi:cell division protein FtsQ
MSKGAKLSLLMISLTILFMASLMSGMIRSSHWNIDNIELDAEFKRVNSEQIRVAVASYPERSFFKVKVNDIRENIMHIPWVQQVTIKKKWPNSIIIKVIEHKAVAVWNDNKLLNEKGEVFKVDSIDDLAALPSISGNDGNSQQIWDKYIRFNDIVKSTGFDIDTTKVSSRGGWSLYLSNGININLGSQKMDAKLVRLTDTWTKLLNKNKQLPHYIDLRYTNGYVVKWPQSNNRELQQQQLGTGNNNG